MSISTQKLTACVKGAVSRDRLYLYALSCIHMRTLYYSSHRPCSQSMQVLPDLVRFMDNSDSKIMAAHNINGKLQVETGVAGNPAVQES